MVIGGMRGRGRYCLGVVVVAVARGSLIDAGSRAQVETPQRACCKRGGALACSPLIPVSEHLMHTRSTTLLGQFGLRASVLITNSVVNRGMAWLHD